MYSDGSDTRVRVDARQVMRPSAHERQAALVQALTNIEAVVTSRAQLGPAWHPEYTVWEIGDVVVHIPSLSAPQSEDAAVRGAHWQIVDQMLWDAEHQVRALNRSGEGRTDSGLSQPSR